MKKSFRKGALTIPELVIVITILAILATIGIVSFMNYSSQSRDTVRVTDLKNITKILGLQKLDEGRYPIVSDRVDVTYSGAIVWNQGVFGQESIIETKKIFGELKDPKHNTPYTYSTTANRREYQIAAYFEKASNTNLVSYNSDFFSIPSAYAAGEFNPNDLNPIIWLDALDIDGDENTGNNPSNGTSISSWRNKAAPGASNDPTFTHGDLRYATNAYSSLNGGQLPGVFIANNRGLRLDNSNISNGSIFYVVQKNDPFGLTDSNGFGIRGVGNDNYYFGFNRDTRKNAIRLGNNPNINGTSNSVTYPYIFHLGVSNGNYELYDTGNRINNGTANSINSVEWAFNRAGGSGRRSDLVIPEVLVFDYALSIAERQMIEGYLAHKWEQENYLPSNHPYKSAPPEALSPPTPDTTPDAFVVDDISNANPATQYISNPFTVQGINTPVNISVSDGEYSVNGASYRSDSSQVSVGDIVRVRITSSNTSNGVVNVTINVGGVTEDFVVTTKTIDDTLDPLSFSQISDADISTLYTSQAQLVSGINVPLQISITGTGAEYKITDGIANDATGAGVAAGVYRNSSSLPEYAFDDNLSLGWGSPNNSFPVSLIYDFGAGNAQSINAYTLYRSNSQNGWNNNRYSPEDWQFQGSNNGSVWETLDVQNNQQITTGAAPREFNFSNSKYFRYYRFYITSAVNSNRVNISEIELLNRGDGVFTSANSTINAGDYVIVRIPSSSEYSTDAVANLQIGSNSTDFVVNTIAPPADYDPDIFTFSSVSDAAPSTQYISNPVNITGITVNTSISITGGEYEINNSGVWSSASSPNLVAPNDSISVRGTSPAAGGQTQTVTLQVGSESADYNITTLLDNVPNTISFSDKTGVTVNTQVESDVVIIGGINTSITLQNVIGGEYKINNGSWRTNATTLQENDRITLRLNSSSSFNATTSMSLDIAGQSYNFSVTTQQADITPDDFTFADIIDADLSFSYISEAITVTDINSATAISISGGEYRIGNGDFTSDPGFVQDGDTVSIRLLSANQPNQTTISEVTIGGKVDYFEITTKEVQDIEEENFIPESNVYVGGDFNGLITHAQTGSIHFILATPSIISYDLSNPDLNHIISEKKLVYQGFDNIPESYKNTDLTMSGGFDFTIQNPLLYEGTKEDLGSYSGLKEVDEGVRGVFNNFPVYANIAKYLDTFSLVYLEDILGNSIGINPIKPYYCSDILRSKLVYNIASQAEIVADTPEISGMEEGISNGLISTEIGEDPEYISRDGNAGIDFSWKSPQRIGYIRLYNTTRGASENLSDAVITFYNEFGGIIDTHSISFDTTGDYIVDLDFESVGKIYYAQKVRIQTTGGKKLSLREVEIYLGGELRSGEYKVDKDGAGGLSPYNVYCDMETDGGGWTRIGDNFITNGKFLKGMHTPEYTYADPLNNIIVDGTTKLPPVYASDAYVLRHQGGINDSYELSFDNIPGKYYAQEIRLGAWVDGTDSSIFSYDINYESEPAVSGVPDYSITQTDGTWNYVEARILLDDVVENFTWKLGDGIAGPIYITDLSTQVYYK